MGLRVRMEMVAAVERVFVKRKERMGEERGREEEKKRRRRRRRESRGLQT